MAERQRKNQKAAGKKPADRGRASGKAAQKADKPRPKQEVQEPSFMKGGNRKGGKKPKGDKPKGKPPRHPSQRPLTLAIAVVAVAAAAAILFLVFHVKTIEVVGVERYTPQQVVQLSGLKEGEQIFLADLEGAAERIRQDPYLQVLAIRRVLPNRIRIEIAERKEAAAISYQNLVVIVDHDGYVLSIGNRADLTGLIQVRGMREATYSVNQRLGEQTDFFTNTLIAILKALREHNLSQEIAFLDISNPLSVHMLTVDGLDVSLGQPEGLPEKLESFAAILPDLKRGDLIGGTLHLSQKHDPVYTPPQETPDPGDTDPGDTDPDDTEPDNPDTSPTPEP